MKRITYIEQVRRFIYNGQPPSEATVTIGLVNVWLNQAIAVAAQKNYTDNVALDGIAYINGSFYTTYKNIAVTKDEQFLYKVQLPHIPFGLGDDEGVSELILTDGVKNAYPTIWINQNQRTYYRGMRNIPNKLISYSEGEFIYIQSNIPLTALTAKVTMVSGGDSTNLNSTLNVPDNYFPVMTEYLIKNLMTERNVPADVTNDGADVIQTT